MLGDIIGNVDRITLGIDVETLLGSLHGLCVGSNEIKCDGSLLG